MIRSSFRLRPVLASAGIAFLLAACTDPNAPPHPVATRLTSDELRVTLSDGTRCVTPWEKGSGTFPACGTGLTWRVDEERRPNLVRQLWSGVGNAVRLERAIPPMADITLTMNGRDYPFVSPSDFPHLPDVSARTPQSSPGLR